MIKLLVTGTVVLGMTAGVALAQATTSETTTSKTTTTMTPAVVGPPEGSVVTRTGKSPSAEGPRTETTETTYRSNSTGVTNDSTTQTTTNPAPEVTTTTKKTTTSVTE
jgi:hypothetical protein